MSATSVACRTSLAPQLPVEVTCRRHARLGSPGNFQAKIDPNATTMAGMKLRNVVGLLVLVTAALCATACGGGALSHVTERAAFDLNCSGREVQVTEGSSCTYYARGCGKKAAYIVRPKAAGSFACCPPIGCDAVLNSAIAPE